MSRKSPEEKSVGLARRLAAGFYDLLLLAALWMLVTGLFVLSAGGEALNKDSTLFHVHRVSLVLVTLAFFVGFWTRGGQTLGMRAWRFRVVREDGSGMRMSDSLVRACCALLSLLPAGLGFAWALLDRERRCWHDRLSRTRLVRAG